MLSLCLFRLPTVKIAILKTTLFAHGKMITLDEQRSSGSYGLVELPAIWPDHKHQMPQVTGKRTESWILYNRPSPFLKGIKSLMLPYVPLFLKSKVIDDRLVIGHDFMHVDLLLFKCWKISFSFFVLMFGCITSNIMCLTHDWKQKFAKSR